MRKRKVVLQSYNSLSSDLQKEFLLEYLVRDHTFPIGKWREDEDFMVEAIGKKKEMLLMYTRLWERKSFVCKVAKYTKTAILNAKCPLDSDIISLALELKPKSLQYCKRDIRNDKEIVMKCLGKTYGNIIFVGETLLDDVDILRKCLSQSETLRSVIDCMSVKELMKEIVKRYPLALLRFYKWLKVDIDFQVKTARSITINGKLYNYHNEMLEHVEDLQVVRKLVSFSGRKYNYFSLIVREDVETFKLAMSNDSEYVSCFPDSIIENRDLLIWLMENGCSNISIDGIIGRNYPNDDELTNHLFKKYFTDVIERKDNIAIPYYLLSHEKLCRKSIMEFPGSLLSFYPSISDKLLADEELMFEYVLKFPRMMKYLNKLSNDVLVKCLQANPQIFSEFTDCQLYNILSSRKHLESMFKIDPKFLESSLLREELKLSEQIIENILSVNPDIVLLFPKLKVSQETSTVNSLSYFEKVGNWVSQVFSQFDNKK